MGLDITAYSHLKAVGKHTEDWCDDYENHVQAFAYDSFPQSFRGVPVLGTRTVNASTFLEGGCFAITDQTQTLGFRAGSYSGYGEWRESLQRQFNPGRDPDSPFYELIWFADNEGAIGPDAARDLLADFQTHAAAYVGDGWMQKKYLDWTSACRLAADNGLIDFH